jgi:hypothetical protein
MAETPSKVMVPVRVPLYVKRPDGEFVQVATVSAEVAVDITVAVPGQGVVEKLPPLEPDRAPWDPQA